MLILVSTLLAVVLPAFYWPGGAETAPTLQQAGITHILVPASKAESWKSVSEVDVQTADPQRAVKVSPPGITFRMSESSASRVPWVTSNGWQFIRQPKGRFYYDVSGNASALAAAEAFCYGANAIVQTDASGLKPFGDMLNFLAGINSPQGPPLADIGFIDDGSPAAGEVMNLLVRDNLLFKIVGAPDPDLKVTVRLGSREYPTQEAKNADALVHKVRANLTDARRRVRIYGTSIVVARITEESGGLRLHLLNYGSAKGTRVEAFRVRIRGHYSKAQLHSFNGTSEQVTEFALEPGATEFTVPELKTYAAIDLSE
jgi:hypothetical protein